MILIGSKAIKHWFPDFNREPKDFDFATIIKIKGSVNCEFIPIPIIANNFKDDVLNPNALATLKASHLFWDINWDKHMFDLQFLLSMGCEIDSELFVSLYEYWNIYHSENKRSRLDKTKKDFFDNAINYNEHEHDYIHTLLNPTPIYTLVLKDGKEVELCENKFNKLTHEQKLNFVREEVMVMAYERYKKLPFFEAYSKMLRKFIRDHAPFFSVLFILKNYKELSKPKFNYYDTIKTKLQRNQKNTNR